MKTSLKTASLKVLKDLFNKHVAFLRETRNVSKFYRLIARDLMVSGYKVKLTKKYSDKLSSWTHNELCSLYSL